MDAVAGGGNKVHLAQIQICVMSTGGGVGVLAEEGKLWMM